LVSPYKDQRDKFKEKMGDNLVEVYIHTTEIRGREDFFVKEYEKPTERYLSINTTNESVEESTKKVLDYAKSTR
jgi:adenylylsulfate kinase